MKKLRLKNNHMNKKLPCGAAFLLGKALKIDRPMAGGVLCHLKGNEKIRGAFLLFARPEWSCPTGLRIGLCAAKAPPKGGITRMSQIRPLQGLGFSTKSLLSSVACGATPFLRKGADALRYAALVTQKVIP